MRRRFEEVRRRKRNVSKVFRVSAVRLHQPQREAESPPRLIRWLGGGRRETPAAVAGGEAHSPVPDEELVEALWRKKKAFEESVKKHASDFHCQVLEVALEDARPADSVLISLSFETRARGNAVTALAGAPRAVIIAVGEILPTDGATRVVVSAAPEPPASATREDRAGWSQLAPILAAIGTGIGVIGFVTFVGGVIVWARLTANGFPAAPALGVFPSQDLLVIGAQTLVKPVIFALAAVVGLVLAYVLLRNGWDRVGEEEAALVEGNASFLAATGMFAFVLLALLAALVPVLSEMKPEHQDIAWLVVFGAAFLAAAVGSVTRRFLLLITATFVLVGTFLGLVAYWTARNDTSVRAAALIRDNKKAMAGIFVAEGAGRVYLARVSRRPDGSFDRARSRLVGVDKDQVTDIAISEAKPADQALTQARHLARELCDLQPNATRPKRGELENCRTAPPGEPQPHE
jgi:hypothetical protein